MLSEMLCANPDPSFSAIYGVCDRMNNAESSETVSKEAARAIRKQFKHGNEGERRAVAVVWLLMMRNVPTIRGEPFYTCYGLC
jgi:serine/threonine protein phosphatase PrpC